MSTIVLICFLIVVPSCFGSDPLYEEARSIWAEKRAHYLALYKEYHIPSSDFSTIQTNETDSPDNSNFKAQILMEYKRLIKRGHCKIGTYKDCVTMMVPNKNKCEKTNGPCDKNRKYAPIGGHCNNLKNPNFGRANTTYKYWFEPKYSDGIYAPRKAKSGKNLPNARYIGDMLDVDDEDSNVDTNLASIMFGQLIAHDISDKKRYTIKARKSGELIRCCTLSNDGPLSPDKINPYCLPIEMPKNDSFYAPKGIFCQNFVRMNPKLSTNCDVATKAENKNSALFDLTNVYSDSQGRLNDELRTGSRGLMRMDESNVLPYAKEINFTAGDLRIHQTPQLAQMHSLMYRLHNTVARKLDSVNSHWNGDKIFFEARRITIAIFQHIVYNEWLPLFLGRNTCKSYKLICGDESNPCDEYDENIDTSASVEVSHNALRVFHKYITTNVQFVDKNYDLVMEHKLSDLFEKNYLLRDKKLYNNLLRGMMKQKMRTTKIQYSAEMRNYLFKKPYRGGFVGSDQVILDVMRSRDSGTAPYIKYYGPCLSKKISNWSDLEPYFEHQHFEQLKQLYEHIEDIDLVVGLLLEKHVKSSQYGVITTCLIAEEYYRFKYGDRFFYSHPTNPYKFTSDQMHEITKMTFAKMVCLVTDIEHVPQEGLIALSKDNPLVKCSKFNVFNVHPFKE